MRLAGTRLKDAPRYAGLTRDTKAGPVWTGDLRFVEKALDAPLRWRTPRMIFVNSMSDLFHENVPDEWIDMIFGVMASCPRHTFQVLTKRSARMRKYLLALQAEGPDRLRHYIDVTMAPSRAARQALSPPMVEPPPPTPELRALYDRAIEAMRARGIRQHSNRVSNVDLPEYHWRGWPLKNVWLGVSAEDQARADERVPDLLATPAAIRFVSAEPLLGPINFHMLRNGDRTYDALQGAWAWGPEDDLEHGGACPKLDQIIVGGESGPHARLMPHDAPYSIRDQCAATGVAFFMKQMAKKAPIPAELLIRQMPHALPGRAA